MLRTRRDDDAGARLRVDMQYFPQIFQQINRAHYETRQRNRRVLACEPSVLTLTRVNAMLVHQSSALAILTRRFRMSEDGLNNVSYINTLWRSGAADRTRNR